MVYCGKVSSIGKYHYILAYHADFEDLNLKQILRGLYHIHDIKLVYILLALGHAIGQTAHFLVELASKLHHQKLDDMRVYTVNSSLFSCIDIALMPLGKGKNSSFPPPVY